MDCLIPFRRSGRALNPVTLPVAGRPSDLFDAMVRDFFGESWPATTAARDGDHFAPALAVHDDESTFTVKVELPGVDAKDVSIELDGNTLVLSGKKEEEHSGKENGTRWTERRYGSFRRALELPTPVVADAVKATADKGVLTVVLPKAKPTSGRKIQVESR